MATETVKVTIEDIREACFARGTTDYNETCECPIARAVRRTHPEWGVEATFIDARGERINLPFEATLFINRFDHEQPVEPFEFEIEV